MPVYSIAFLDPKIEVFFRAYLLQNAFETFEPCLKALGRQITKLCAKNYFPSFSLSFSFLLSLSLSPFLSAAFVIAKGILILSKGRFTQPFLTADVIFVS